MGYSVIICQNRPKVNPHPIPTRNGFNPPYRPITAETLEFRKWRKSGNGSNEEDAGKQVMPTLPRLGSRVRIPSPAPEIAEICDFLNLRFSRTPKIPIYGYPDLGTDFGKNRVSTILHRTRTITLIAKVGRERTSSNQSLFGMVESTSSSEGTTKSQSDSVGSGMSSEAAGIKAGFSQPVGTRWFREAGGMPPTMFRETAKPLSGRYLSLAEREEIALLLVQNYSLREIGRRIDRSASTISREVRRNAATRGGRSSYRATVAQWHAERSALRPKPEQVARRLIIDFPNDETMRISHKAIIRRFTSRVDCLPENRTDLTNAARTYRPAWQELRFKRYHDKPTSR